MKSYFSTGKASQLSSTRNASIPFAWISATAEGLLSQASTSAPRDAKYRAMPPSRDPRSSSRFPAKRLGSPMTKRHGGTQKVGRHPTACFKSMAHIFQHGTASTQVDSRLDSRLGLHSIR